MDSRHSIFSFSSNPYSLLVLHGNANLCMILQALGMHDHDFLGKLWGVQIPREFEVRGRNSLRFTRMPHSPKG